MTINKTYKPMISIIHGENQAQSRDELVKQINQLKNSGYTVDRVQASKLTLAVLEEQLGSVSLFDSDQALVIEELHSLPRSTKKSQLIQLIAQSHHKPILLWEKRSLTPTMIKQFPNCHAKEFKLSKNLFRWLDAIGAPASTVLKLQGQVMAEDGEQMALAMLMRQIRLLIDVKSGGRPAGPPFMISKLQKQAQTFTLDQLTNLHTQLLEIDLHQKTSGNALTLAQELDLLVSQR